jgi:signal peptidase I
MESRDRWARAVRRLLGGLAGALWIFVALTHGVAFVSGGSMEPVLHAGDIVIYRLGARGVMVGDLVVFAHPEWSGGVVHRVTSIDSDGSLVTRGDANPTDDSDAVTRDRVRGVAVAVVPSGKVVALAAEATR